MIVSFASATLTTVAFIVDTFVAGRVAHILPSVVTLSVSASGSAEWGNAVRESVCGVFAPTHLLVDLDSFGCDDCWMVRSLGRGLRAYQAKQSQVSALSL